jgi:hypothetical protein
LIVFTKFVIIKAKSFMGSIPHMLNLLWNDGHPCYIYKNEKNIVGTRFKGFKPFANVGF